MHGGGGQGKVEVRGSVADNARFGPGSCEACGVHREVLMVSGDTWVRQGGSPSHSGGEAGTVQVEKAAAVIPDGMRRDKDEWRIPELREHASGGRSTRTH